MKYYVVEGTFINDMSVSENDLQKAIEKHIAFLQKGFDNGTILVSGPKIGVDGGIIIIKGRSLEEIKTYLSEDPLDILGIQEYKFVEFKLHDCQPFLREWFD